MPTSAKTFNKQVEKLLRKYISKGMKRFLDVGAGSGKYGKMLNSFRVEGSEELYDFFMDAIEPDEEYAREYKLHEIYNRLYYDTVQSFSFAYPTYCTNVVIFGDVLEHLPKSTGINVLEHFIYRSNFVIVVVPKQLVQFSEEHPAENHISIWREEDFLKYGARVRYGNNKILATMPGFFNYPDAVISKSSYEIMKEQGCTRFRGTIMDRG
jgi:hypothetical protein